MKSVKTANLMNRCLQGKMSVKEHFSVVFNLFKTNLKDIFMIGFLFALPVALMTMIGFRGIIGNLINIFCTAISMAAITILIDRRAKGEDIGWKDAIKKTFNNPILAISAFLMQSLLINVVTMFGGGFIATLFGSLVMLNIQFAVLSGMDMIGSTKASFSIVSKNLVDVLIKNILLNFVISLPVALVMSSITSLTGVNQMNQGFFAIVLLVSGILTTISVIASVVFYYNLPTVNNTRA